MNGNKNLFLDTNILIHFFEQDSILFDGAQAFFKWCTQNNTRFGISSLVVAEYLVSIYKNQQSELPFFIFLESVNIKIHPFTVEEAKRTAHLRTRYQEKLPDLALLSTAIEHKYDVFISEDKALKKIIEIPVLSMQEFLDLFQK